MLPIKPGNSIVLPCVEASVAKSVVNCASEHGLSLADHLPTPRPQSLRLSGRCPPAHCSAPQCPSHRTDSAIVERALRGQPPALGPLPRRTLIWHGHTIRLIRRSVTGYHSNTVMESQEILRDIRSTMLHLREIRPDIIGSADWFIFKDGFRDNLEPKLIALNPIGEDGEEADASVKKWAYCDINLRTPRGILTSRIMLPGQSVFIFEIRRRAVARKDGSRGHKNCRRTIQRLSIYADRSARFALMVAH